MDTPQLLAKEDYISPDAYMATLPGAIECKRTIKNILSFQKKEGTAGQTVRIMELGARNLGLTSELLDCMDGIEYEYVCTDASSYYLNQAKEKFKNNSRVHYENLDINSAPNTQGLAMHYFDVVLAVSTLHRCRDIKASLKYAGEYLRAGGLLILLETTENTILQHVSTGILEKGFSTVTDERKGTGKPLLTKDQWSDAVLKCGFAKVNTAPNDQLDLPIYNQGVIVALAQPETYAFNSTKLKAYLENIEYLNKPEETNAHFMYDEQLQERIYKTGDIGRYWPDGTIEFMGREDTQVKIHGHRIELSEIESALLSNTLVKTAVAVIVGKRPQDYKIVAFVEGNIEVSELTEYIKTQVPEYMVPSRFEVNEKIPLSANGKVERKALKKLAETYFQNTGKCEMPPHEGLEKEIAELWKTLLKIDRVNRTDNFYDIGGDSLLVAQAVSKTKEAINVAKDVEWDRLMIGMLQNPTIMDFAQFLNSVQIGTSHEENEISETPLNIIADIPEGGEVMKVFFPGGIGFLQQFNTLFQILVNNPERTEGIAAFNYTEDKEYLDSEEKDHIVTIGRRYADLLLNSGYRKFKLIGYCMGGLVAIEAARALLEAGAEVLPVVTIDTIPIVLEMEGDLLMERSYGLMVGADVSKAGHVKRDELVQMALELLKDHNNGFIEEDAILGLTGELSELAACYKKQKTLSKRERMENLKNAIPENSMQLSSEDMNRFDELFEIYKRNYRCAIGYTPKPFAGDLQALSCMDDHSPFVPVMKPGTEAFLSKCALGNLEVLPIGGNHLSCLMTPNVEGMANLLDGKGERV